MVTSIDRRVWKYQIYVDRENVLQIPDGARLRHFEALDSYVIEMWAEIWLPAELVSRKFIVFGTGHKILPGSNCWHVGTVKAPPPSHPFVWHVFEMRR